MPDDSVPGSAASSSSYGGDAPAVADLSSSSRSVERDSSMSPDDLSQQDLLRRAEQEELEQYVNDLQAANRFKTYLLTAGVEVPADVIEGLAKLTENMISRGEIPARSADVAQHLQSASAAPMVWTST